jgi:hypothetical protein
VDAYVYQLTCKSLSLNEHEYHVWLLVVGAPRRLGAQVRPGQLKMGQVRTARAKSRPIRSSPTCPHRAKPSQISSSHGGQFVPIPRGNHVSIVLRPPLHQHIPRHSQAKSARDLTQPNLTQIRSDWTRLDQTGRNQSVLATTAIHSAQQ